MTPIQSALHALPDEKAPPVPMMRSASEPPEARGLARDQVRLLVAGDGLLRHVLFRDLGAFLAEGDLVVVNTSATVPAAVDGRRSDGTQVKLHFSTPLGRNELGRNELGRNELGPNELGANGLGATQPGAGELGVKESGEDDWLVELRRAGAGRVRDARVGERIDLPGGVVARLRAAYPDRRQRVGSRLWVAHVPTGGPALDYLQAFGRPITYDHLAGQWPIASYQTIFAAEPGSAEMPSAGRPFSPALLVDLAVRGVVVAPVTLHAGVSSLEAGERPLPERYRVPAATARLVNATRAAGARVVAVGTTVTRALETVASADGVVTVGAGWTRLVLGPDRPARVVDGLVTGWHDPHGSHVALLEAVAGVTAVAEAHRSAMAEGYRWHEFGDACLLLRGRTGSQPPARPG